jgi:hypothetical protein
LIAPITCSGFSAATAARNLAPALDVAGCCEAVFIAKVSVEKGVTHFAKSGPEHVGSLKRLIRNDFPALEGKQEFHL